MTSKGRWLYLFSSDQSPLYAQDILNVLAAPHGHRYTFRYDARYLGPGLVETWDQLRGVEVLVVFSVQQRAQYHPPAFIPIRTGCVVGTHREGDSHFVDFRLSNYLSLAEAPTTDGKEAPQDRVRMFTDLLGELTAVPYRASAGLGEPIPARAHDSADEQTVLFERTARYLQLTAAFDRARFIRVLGIKPTGSTDADRIQTTLADPTFVLEAGTTYDLELFHAQPSSPAAPEPFKLDVDGSTIRTVGRAGFDIASRYDRIVLRLVATEAGGLEDRETVVTLAPGGQVQGPEVVLNVRVRARRKRTLGIASLQTLALVAVALAGALDDWPWGARVALAVIGAMAAVALGLMGSGVLKAPSMPSRSTVAEPAPRPRAT